jgi:hypothetical protein
MKKMGDDHPGLWRQRPHISVSRFASRVGRCPVRRLSLHSGDGVGSQQRVIGLVRRRTGLPMMSGEMTVPQCRVALAPAASHATVTQRSLSPRHARQPNLTRHPDPRRGNGKSLRASTFQS